MAESAGTAERRDLLSIAVCMKWVALRPDIDRLTGAVHTDDRWSGASAADLAALELALSIAEARTTRVTAYCVGPHGADAILRDALACGAHRAIRIDCDTSSEHQPTSRAVGYALANAVRETIGVPSLVLCGDWSLDRGSGSVPAFVASRLELAYSGGLVLVAQQPDNTLLAERRLDGGRRERLRIDGPAVLSVEGSTASLRRASLRNALRANAASVEMRPTPHDLVASDTVTRARPFRPRARVLDAPPTSASPLERVIALTGALTSRTPPERVTLAPSDAAARILQALDTWGYEQATSEQST